MINTFIFDIGNVVLYFNHEKMIQQLSLKLQVSFSKVKTRLFDEEILKLFELGQFSEEHLFEELLQLSSVKPPKSELLASWNEIFQENQSLTPILNSLKRQRKKLLLLSNISESHFNYISNKYPHLKIFDAAILSYKVHHAKPASEIFQKVLAIADCAPQECFYTDDIIGHVEAARLLNIDAELFESAEQLTQQLASRMVFV